MSAMQQWLTRVAERARTPRLPRLDARLRSPLPVAVAVLAVVAVVLAMAALAARAEAGRARQAERAATERLAAVQAAASGAEEARGAAASAIAQAEASASQTVAERDELHRRLDAASKDLETLQGKLAQVTATAEQQTALATQQHQQVRVLTECLSGTLVAVEFGRSGRWSSADRALDAVKESCTAARALL